MLKFGREGHAEGLQGRKNVSEKAVWPKRGGGAASALAKPSSVGPEPNLW